jgi:hypothetical protein
MQQDTPIGEVQPIFRGRSRRKSKID